jgi:hypothetical protein
MSIESTIVDTITSLCSRVYPDVAPRGTTKPYVTYQQVGGRTIDPLDGDPPGTRNARVQINVWGATRAASTALMNDIEDALRAPPISARPVGALMARYDETTELRGAQQDFSLWVAD